jgi:hypothetical protein
MVSEKQGNLAKFGSCFDTIHLINVKKVRDLYPNLFVTPHAYHELR